MTSFSQLTTELETSVEQLNGLLQGDENTTVEINGVQKPSVEKKTKDTVNAQVQFVLDAAADIDSVKYQTVAAGIAATTDGQFFSVVSSDPENYLNLYKNQSGVAVFDKSYPTTALIESMKEDTVRPLKLAYSINNKKINEAFISMSLSGNFEKRLITLAALTYTNGQLVIILASPDSENEEMGSSTNTKYVSRVVVDTQLTGVKTFNFEKFGFVDYEIEGYLTIDLDKLVGFGSVLANYIAKDRLFDKRAIINLNCTFDKLKYISDKTENLATEIGEVFNPYNASLSDGRATRLKKAIKQVSIKGDYKDSIVTLSNFSYNSSTKSFSIFLSLIPSLDTVVTTSNPMYRVGGTHILDEFSGTKTLELTEINSSGVSCEITIDFDELSQNDAYTASFTGHERAFNPYKLKDANGALDRVNYVNTKINLFNGHSEKTQMLQNAVVSLTLYDEIPNGKFLVLNALQYSGNELFCYINIADDEDSVGVNAAIGSTTNTSGITTILLDRYTTQSVNLSGMIQIDMSKYPSSNVGAATTADQATYRDRGLNTDVIKKEQTLNPLVKPYANQFLETCTFNRAKLLNDYIKRSLRIYPQKNLGPDDKLILSLFRWTESGGIYRLTYQFRKVDSDTQPVMEGSLVYTGSFVFNSLDEIKGIHEIEDNSIGGFDNPAIIEVDLTYLPFIDNYTSSMYFQNVESFNYTNAGLDIDKVNYDSAKRYASKGTGGLSTYDSLVSAVNLNAQGVFAVGGNLFKNSKVNGDKNDIRCINSPAKLLSKKPTKETYDVYFDGAKIKLESIDSNDLFYFINANSVLRVSNPLTHEKTIVPDNSSGFVMHNVDSGIYYSLADYELLFTNVTVGVDSFKNLKNTYDDELFIISDKAGLRSISLTENNCSQLRSFDFNGTVTDVFSFGAGVNITKDWSMSHHGDVMFISDYDSGVDGGPRGETGGQRCYVSTDNGYTFTECFAFNGEWTNLTNAADITNFGKAQAHIHGVCYDPKENLVMLITGDGAITADNSAFIWSRDLGQTWTHTRSVIKDTGQKSQMVNAIPFDGCMAFGSDAGNLNGVGVITYNGEEMVHEVARNFIPNENLLFAFSRSVWDSHHSDIKYMSFGKNTQYASDSRAINFVCSSSNGYTWDLVWEDNNPAIYGNVFAFDDSKGNLYISLDGSGDYKDRLIVCSVKYY